MEPKLEYRNGKGIAKLVKAYCNKKFTTIDKNKYQGAEDIEIELFDTVYTEEGYDWHKVGRVVYSGKLSSRGRAAISTTFDDYTDGILVQMKEGTQVNSLEAAKRLLLKLEALLYKYDELIFQKDIDKFMSEILEEE